MEILLEILMRIVLEPVLTLFAEPMAENIETNWRMPTWLKVILIALFFIVFLSMFSSIILGSILLAARPGSEKTIGLILLLTGIGALVTYIIFIIIRVNRKKAHIRRIMTSPSKFSSSRVALRRIVHVVIDRPLGSTHPEHSDIVYELNYGFVTNAMGGDGDAQDAYVLGVDEPISEFDGVVIAVIHRLDDNEDKWVVAHSGYKISDEEIIEKTKFQEKYFNTKLIR